MEMIPNYFPANKRIKLSVCLFVLFVSLFSTQKILSQVSCENINFSEGDFTNWIGYTGSVVSLDIELPDEGIVYGRHTIMDSISNKFDPNTGNLLKCTPPEYRYAARLGNDKVGGEAESLEYKIIVDQTNNLLTWKFAVVMEEPGHYWREQPRFKITLRDSKGEPIDECAEYLVHADEHIPGFNKVENTIILWRDWTTVALDLSNRIGEELTIEFVTTDCSKKEHFGYAYFVAECSSNEISVSYCKDDNVATLTAPEGFESYLWSTGETDRTIYINNPAIADQYTCKLTSVLGCEVTVVAKIERTEIDPDFDYKLIDCGKRQYRFINKSTTNIANLRASWVFDDSYTRYGDEVLHQFASAGNHTVKLIVENLLTHCKDSITKTIAVEAPPIIKLDKEAKFCSSEGSVTVTASGGDTYLWSTGESTATITISTPGDYWVQGTSSTGCTTTYHFEASYTNPDYEIKINYLSCALLKYEFIAENQADDNTAHVYSWNFGDGATSNLQNTEHSYASVGTYTVKLTVTDVTGCSSEFTKFLEVKSTPTITIDKKIPVEFCEGDSILLTASGASAYIWENTYTGETMTGEKVWIKGQKAKYKITGTTDDGCDGKLEFMAEPIPIPDYIITISLNDCKKDDDGTGGGGYGYSFGANEANGEDDEGDSFHWDFGDGDSSDEKDPDHYYDDPGDKEVTVTVTNKYGCSTSYTYQFTVMPMPDLKLDKKAEFCAGDNVTLTVSGADTYLWSTGSTNDKITINTPGDYYVIGNIIGGCSDTLYFKAVRFPLPDYKIEYVVTDCNKGIYEFTPDLLSGDDIGDSYFWDFGDGTTTTVKSPTHTFEQNKTYVVKLIVASLDGCSKEFSVTINVSSKITISLDKSPEFCEGETLNLTASGAENYLWSTGETGNTIEISTPGSYWLKGTTLAGCSDSIAFEAIIHKKPDYEIDYKIENCNKREIQFYANLLSGNAAGDVYLWNFGDGGTSGFPNPKYAYALPGDYTVTLTVVNQKGCLQTYELNLTVTSLDSSLILDTNDFDLCPGDTLIFHALGAEFYEWSDGNQSDSIVITQPGNYFVRGANKEGCFSVLNFEIILNEMPDYKIDYSYLDCNARYFQFDAIELSGIVSNDIYFWDFGDGYYGNIAKPKHAFNDPGQYTVSLTVTNDSGCSKTFEIEIDVKDLPIISILGDPYFCKADSVCLTASGADFYIWKDLLTDAIIGLEDTVCIKTQGEYMLIGTTIDGCENTYTFTAAYFGSPDYTLSVDLTDCNNKTYQFSALENNWNGTNDVYLWNFGDGYSSSEKNPLHQYATAGIYTASLIVYSADGCEFYKEIDITISDLPDLQLIGLQPYCAGDSIIVKVTGADTYEWHDGSALDHILVKTDMTYTVKGINKNGCYAIASFVPTILELPDYEINYALIDCNEHLYSFEAVLLSGNDAADNYLWEFGDGQTATQKNAIHQYNTAGKYTIRLTINNQYACQTTCEIEINVPKQMHVVLDKAPVFCQGEILELTASGCDTYYWSNGTSGNSIVIDKAGDYFVIGKTLEGCTDTLYFSTSYYNHPNYQISYNLINCEKKEYAFSPLNIGNTDFDIYHWDFGDGAVSNEKNPVHIFSDYTDYVITLTVISGDNCTETFTIEMNVEKPPILYFDKDLLFCVGETLDLQVFGADHYLWFDGSTGDKITINKAGIYKLIGYSASGCICEHEFEVLNYPEVNYSIKYKMLDCETNKVAFEAFDNLGIAADHQYYWDFGNGESATFGIITYQYADAGEYEVKLTVSDENKCEKTFTEIIKVGIAPTLYLDKEPIFCKGDSTVVYVYGADYYKWDDGSSGNSRMISEEKSYSVTGYFDSGCFETLVFEAKYSESTAFAIVVDKDEISPDESTVLFSTQNLPGAEYLWDFGDGTILQGYTLSHTYNINGNEDYYDITLTVITPYGCVESSEKRIWIVPTDIPNTFTPNGDGINDYFLEKFRVQIYNRNGILLYEGQNGWDGTHQGKPAVEDTYFYILFYNTLKGERTKEGFITLIRGGL